MTTTEQLKNKFKEWQGGESGFYQWLSDIKPRILTRSNSYEVFEPTVKQQKFICKMLETDKNGVILQQMSYHQHQVSVLGKLNKFEALCLVEDQRLFHIYMLACQKRLACQCEMGLGRGGDHDALDVFPAQHIIQSQAGVQARILFLEMAEHGLVLVADELEGAEVVVVTHQVLAPVTGADDGDVGIHSLLHFLDWIGSLFRLLLKKGHKDDEVEGMINLLSRTILAG